jgi:hypothetical protein
LSFRSKSSRIQTVEIQTVETRWPLPARRSSARRSALCGPRTRPLVLSPARRSAHALSTRSSPRVRSPHAVYSLVISVNSFVTLAPFFPAPPLPPPRLDGFERLSLRAYYFAPSRSRFATASASFFRVPGCTRSSLRNRSVECCETPGFLAPSPEQPRRPGEWQTYDITLVGRVVTVVQNGQTIIDKQEIPGITGGALDSHEALPGPIYLQGGEAGHVAFRNITITPAR